MISMEISLQTATCFGHLVSELSRLLPSSRQDFKVDVLQLFGSKTYNQLPPQPPHHHQPTDIMGRAKKVRKFAAAKRVIGKRDARLRENQIKQLSEVKKKPKTEDVVREVPQVPSNLFFQYNQALRPPYQVLVDTNFINHSIQKKLELIESMMDCLYAKATPVITDCVMAELEKLGTKYRIALRIARDPRFIRLKCDHKVYADDCLVDRVMQHQIYIVATNDRDLKRRIRKIPGVPIMTCATGKYVIERLPDAPEK